MCKRIYTQLTRSMRGVLGFRRRRRCRLRSRDELLFSVEPLNLRKDCITSLTQHVTLEPNSPQDSPHKLCSLSLMSYDFLQKTSVKATQTARSVSGLRWVGTGPCSDHSRTGFPSLPLCGPHRLVESSSSESKKLVDSSSLLMRVEQLS